jgi:hypothetical protein
LYKEVRIMVSQPNKIDSQLAFPTIEIQASGKKIVDLDIKLSMEVNYSKIQVGNAFVQLIDENSILESIIDYVDTIKNEYKGFYDNLITIDKIMTHVDLRKDNIKGKLAFLQTLQIFPNYRGRKLSKPFIWLISKALKENLKVDFVLLHPFPFEINVFDKTFSKEEKRLEKIYSKSGFTKRIHESYCFMFTNLKQKSFTHFK